jgi:integrase
MGALHCSRTRSSWGAGVNVLARQRMLGHKSAKVTLDTYADLFDDDLDAVAVTLHSRYSHDNAAKVRPRMPS